MEMAYIQAENLKHKRTFTKTLMVLAPFVTALMNFFAPLWFQLNSYNWWYILLYPGFLTLTCALIEQRDNGKLKYRAVASLPISQNKVWKAKIGVAGIYSCVGNFIFLALNLLGGFAILVINEIPLTIGIGQAVAGTVCIVIASLWEIPLCLWLSKKVGIFVAVILNAGLGSVLGIFTATTSLWMICPYTLTCGWNGKRRCWKPTTKPCTRKRTRPKRTQPARTPPRKQKREAAEWSCKGRISLQLRAAFYMFLGNPGTIRAPQHTFLQNGLHTATFAGHHKSGYHGHHFRKSSGTGHHRKQGKSLENVVFSRLFWRRRWDSNPRALADYLISSRWKALASAVTERPLAALKNGANRWYKRTFGDKAAHIRQFRK